MLARPITLLGYTINLCNNQCIRIERVNMKEIRSIAKVIGTLVTFAGALMMILYKGPQIHLFYSPKSAHNSGSHDTQTLKHWVSGTLFLMMGCVAWSSFFILQANIILFFNGSVFFCAILIRIMYNKVCYVCINCSQ